jgi:hypothetical protein
MSIDNVMRLSKPKVEKCVRCGAYHDWYPHNCLAVKKITYRPYVYGSDGHTVSHSGIESVEYVSVEEQQKLLRMNENAQPPQEETA